MRMPYRKDQPSSIDMESDGPLDVDAKRRSNSVSHSHYPDWNSAHTTLRHATAPPPPPPPPPPNGFSSTTTMMSPIEQSVADQHNVGELHSTSAFPPSRSAATLNRMPSQQWSTKSTTTNKRASTTLLESKLPNFMRGNLPKFDEYEDALPSHERFPPPPMPDHGMSRSNDSNYARYFSQWWHSHSLERHDKIVKRTLQRRLLVKNLVVTALAEFVGTFFFLFFALAINTTCSNVKEASGTNGNTFVDLIALLVSSLGFGFSLAISAWVFFRVSGGVQNPAITLALTLTGALTWLQFIVLTVVQYVGGIAAAGLISGLYPGTVDSRTTLGPDTTVNQGFWLEFFMSAQLIFTVLMLAAEKHRATFLAPVGIGLALFITQLLGQPYTGASVNPARTLGPDVVQKTFSSSCWIYYVSSYLAAIVTSGFFLLLKWVRYETATPDQDADETGARLTRQVMIDANGNVIGVMDVLSNEEFDARLGIGGSGGDDEEKNIPHVASAFAGRTSTTNPAAAVGSGVGLAAAAGRSSSTAAIHPIHQAATTTAENVTRGPSMDIHPPAAFVVPSQPEQPVPPTMISSPTPSVLHRQLSLHNTNVAAAAQPTTRYYYSTEYSRPRGPSDVGSAPVAHS